MYIPARSMTLFLWTQLRCATFQTNHEIWNQVGAQARFWLRSYSDRLSSPCPFGDRPDLDLGHSQSFSSSNRRLDAGPSCHSSIIIVFFFFTRTSVLPAVVERSRIACYSDSSPADSALLSVIRRFPPSCASLAVIRQPLCWLEPSTVLQTSLLSPGFVVIRRILFVHGHEMGKV